MKELSKIIKYHQTLVGNESFLTDIKNRFADSKLFQAVKKALSGLFKDMVIDKSQPEFTTKLEKKLTDIGYMSMTSVTCYVPVNLNVNMYHYVSTLLELLEPLFNESDKYFKESTNFLSMIYNTPELLNTISLPLQKKEVKAHSDYLDNVERQLAECFDSKQLSDELPMGDIYTSVGQIKDTTQAICTLQDTLNRHGIEPLKDRINQLFEIADMLASEVRNSEPDSPYHEVTRPLQDNIAERLYQAARYAELFGLIISQTNILIVAMQDTTKKLNDIY